MKGALDDPNWFGLFCRHLRPKGPQVFHVMSLRMLVLFVIVFVWENAAQWAAKKTTTNLNLERYLFSFCQKESVMKTTIYLPVAQNCGYLTELPNCGTLAFRFRLKHWWLLIFKCVFFTAESEVTVVNLSHWQSRAVTKSARSSVLHGQGGWWLTPSMKVSMDTFLFFTNKHSIIEKQSSPVQKRSYANMPTNSAKFIPWTCTITLLWQNHHFRHVFGRCKIQKAPLLFKSFMLPV